MAQNRGRTTPPMAQLDAKRKQYSRYKRKTDSDRTEKFYGETISVSSQLGEKDRAKVGLKALSIQPNRFIPKARSLSE